MTYLSLTTTGIRITYPDLTTIIIHAAPNIITNAPATFSVLLSTHVWQNNVSQLINKHQNAQINIFESYKTHKIRKNVFKMSVTSGGSLTSITLL